MMMQRSLDSLSLILIGISLALGGCQPGLDNPLTPTGSHSMAFDAAFEALAVVNTDAGTISVIDERSHQVQEVWVGAEPTRIARAGSSYFVSLRAERSIARVERRNDRWSLIQKVKVGTEPYGLVASEYGTRLFAALSTQGEVIEISPKTMEVTQKWAIGKEIRWLALRPQNDTLYAVHAFGNEISHINLNNNRVKTLKLPQGFERSTRFTGDPAFTPDGLTLVLPMLNVDNTTSASSDMNDGNLADLPLEDLEDHAPLEPSEEEFFEQGGYNAAGRFQAGLLEVPVDASNGEPTESSGEIVFIPINNNSDGSVVSGYPTSVAVSPESDFYLSTHEGTHAVVVTSASNEESEPGFFDIVTGNENGASNDNHLNFSFRDHEVVGRIEGARGALFQTNRAIAVDGFLGRGIRFKTLSNILKPPASSHGFMPCCDSPPMEQDIVVEPLVIATQHRLPPEVERGRKLFFSGADASMSSNSSGVSCATCHAEGRNDGLTWSFDSGLPRRQTLSLAGNISQKGRVTWTSEVATVAHEVMLTSQGRMGGRGLNAQSAIDVAAYIDWSREADYPMKNAPIEGRLAQGQALFYAPEIGCAGCHSGSQFGTDATFTLLGAEPTKAISLRGVSMTPPYFHDGSAETLGEVLEQCRSGFMGDTSGLSQGELEALELYLRSL